MTNFDLWKKSHIQKKYQRYCAKHFPEIQPMTDEPDGPDKCALYIDADGDFYVSEWEKILTYNTERIAYVLGSIIRFKELKQKYHKLPRRLRQDPLLVLPLVLRSALLSALQSVPESVLMLVLRSALMSEPESQGRLLSHRKMVPPL